MVRHIFHSILGIGLLVHAAAHAASIRIMPLGDSITHGYWSGIETDYNSYRKVLRNLLEDNGYAADFMGSLVDGDFPDNQHEGQDGYYADHATKTNTVLRHVEAWITAADADILLLHIGTNDIKGNNADASEVSLILDKIFATKPGSTVVLALIINTRIESTLRSDITTYNSNLNVMAQARIESGDDLIVVDMENGAGIDYASADMADWGHPSQRGYDKMATNWYPSTVAAIGRQLEKKRPQIQNIAVSTNLLTLELHNLRTGVAASVERTWTLNEAAWTNIGTIIPTSITTHWSEPISASASNAFYRVFTE